MSHNIRIIPRLDIKGPNLVKGIHLEGLRVLGKPEQFAKYYYENGADELVYMDVVASLYGRNSLHDIIEKTARGIFIPLTVGGGLRTLDDMKAVLRAGADKVCLNTAAVNNPEIIKQASRKFGSSTIVVSIEAIKQPDETYLAFTDNGREQTDKEVVQWARTVQALGAGEIMLTSVDMEGTGHGYDVALTRRISESVSIPVIACGGAGDKTHLSEVIKTGKADAIAIASMFHYNFVNNNEVELDHATEGNLDFIMHKKTLLNIEECDIKEVKTFLLGENIKCRN